MKKSKAVILLIIALLSIPCLIYPTYALFSSTATGEGDVVVARFNPRLNNSTNLEPAIKLIDTATGYSDPYLVPGTSGVIELTLDFANVDISTDYEILPGIMDLPDDLRLYSDSAGMNLFERITGTYEINSASTTQTHYIYWDWVDESDADSIANNAQYLNRDLEAQIRVVMMKRVKASYE